MLQMYDLQHFKSENVPKKAFLAAMKRRYRPLVRGFAAHLCYFGAVLSLVVFNHLAAAPFVSRVNLWGNASGNPGTPLLELQGVKIAPK